MVHEQAKWLLEIVDQHLHDNVTWSRPLSHIIDKPAEVDVTQDASSKWGVGGHSTTLHFYYQITWTVFGPIFYQKVKDTLNKGGIALPTPI